MDWWDASSAKTICAIQCKATTSSYSTISDSNYSLLPCKHTFCTPCIRLKMTGSHNDQLCMLCDSVIKDTVVYSGIMEMPGSEHAPGLFQKVGLLLAIGICCSSIIRTCQNTLGKMVLLWRIQMFCRPCYVS